MLPVPTYLTPGGEKKNETKKSPFGSVCVWPVPNASAPCRAPTRTVQRELGGSTTMGRNHCGRARSFPSPKPQFDPSWDLSGSFQRTQMDAEWLFPGHAAEFALQMPNLVTPGPSMVPNWWLKKLEGETWCLNARIRLWSLTVSAYPPKSSSMKTKLTDTQRHSRLDGFLSFLLLFFLVWIIPVWNGSPALL